MFYVLIIYYQQNNVSILCSGSRCSLTEYGRLSTI